LANTVKITLKLCFPAAAKCWIYCKRLQLGSNLQSLAAALTFYQHLTVRMAISALCGHDSPQPFCAFIITL